MKNIRPHMKNYELLDKIEINGITWATTNIGAKFTEYGSYYTYDEAITYDELCPSGFHVPTIEELKTLLDNTYVTNSWVTNYNGTAINGRLFTEISSGNTLFLPACGYWSYSRGLMYAGLFGSYLSCMKVNGDIVNTLYIDSKGAQMDHDLSHYGLSVRPVKN